MSDARLDDINHVASTTGNDPELDSLPIRLHLKTAIHRGGALDLRLKDLDRSQCLIHVRDKGGTDRWHPCFANTDDHLLAHAEQREATDPDDPLLRSASAELSTL